MSRPPRILPAVAPPTSFVAAAPVGPHALAYLRAFITAARADDPLAPVTVIVPSNYSGLSLRRLLGTQDGVVNVRFLVVSRVAELLAAARFVPDRRPLTPWVRASAIRHALETDAEILAPVRAHPGTARALDATFRELRHSPPGTLEHLASTSNQSREVAGLYDRFRQLTAGYFDSDDLLDAAAHAIEQRSPALRDLGRVVVYLPRDVTPAELRLFSALRRQGSLDVVLGLTGDAEADDATMALATRLGAVDAPPPAAKPAAHHIIDAADTVEEARTIVHSVLHAAESGTPFHRIAILYPQSSRFPGALAAHLAAAGIPFHGRNPRPLAASMPARVLLGMLALPETRFRRTAVMDWLTSGPILAQDPANPSMLTPSASWDEMSRDAGVVVESPRPGPRSHWQRRLDAYARQQRSEERVTRVQSLAAFIQALVADLDPPAGSSPAALAGWARKLLLKYLGSGAQARHWDNEGAAQSYANLLSVLDSASREDQVSPATTGSGTAADRRRRLAGLLEQALASADGRLGPFGAGVYLGPMSSARGMDFDHVFVSGMVEGVLPAPSSEDPLLPDAVREEAALPTRGSRSIDARFDYLCALATAPVRTLSYARSDIGQQSTQRPSRWLMESVALLAGAPVKADNIGVLRPAPWLTVATSFEQSLRTPESEPLSLQEWELRAIAAGGGAVPQFLLEESALGQGLGAATSTLPAWARRTPELPDSLSPWAGGATGSNAAASVIYSPTSFETLARCPFRYFLGNVLRIKETASPEDTYRIEAVDRGTIVHDTLERFFVDAGQRGSLPGPSEPWPEADRNRLLQIAGEIAGTFDAAGKTGGAALWHVDRARILRDLAGFLTADNHRRAETNAEFLHAELRFGRTAPEGASGPGLPPVAVALADGEQVLFRGQIDRVDRASDGQLIVYDYKTGSIDQYKKLASRDDRLDAGRQLQLPIYALAACAAFGDAPVSAHYWAVSESGGYGIFGYSMDEPTFARLGDVLSVLVGLVRHGNFPQVPGKQTLGSNENCRYCPYDRVCPSTSRLELWETRKRTPGLEDYLALADVTPADAQGPEADG